MEQVIKNEKQLLIDWCMQFTDKVINEDIAPIINDLLNDKAFITLLKKWGKEKAFYERFRRGDIDIFITGKKEMPKIYEKTQLHSYSNDVFQLNNALLTIVTNWKAED